MTAQFLTSHTAPGFRALFARAICLLALVVLASACGAERYDDEQAPIPMSAAQTPAPIPASTKLAATPTIVVPMPTAPNTASISVSAKPTHTATPASVLGIAEPTLTAALATPIPEITPEPPMVGSTIYDPGFVTLDEQILRAEIIARASIRSVSSYVYTPGSDDNAAMIRFSFDVHEYLKGNGDAILDVDLLLVWSNFPSEEAALNKANEWIADNAERWPKGKEAVVFVQADDYPKRSADSGVTGQTSSQIYKFVPLYEDEHRLRWNYAFGITDYWKDTFSILSERNRALLPAASAPSGASGASEARFLLGDKPEDLESYDASGVSGASGFATDISLAGLKARIKAVADLVKEGEDVAGYEECLRARYASLREPYYPYSLDFSVASGLPAGNAFASGGTSRNRYVSYFFKGVDEHLFEFEIEDTDNDPSNGFKRHGKNKRPLPQGKYEVEYHTLRAEMLPCMTERISAYWTINATAPDGVLHEAFFDPASFGVGVGASISGDKVGVIEPAEFTHNGANVAIEQIEWSPNLNKVALKLSNQSVSLAGHHIDFIELDASVSLRLDFDDAESTATGYGQTLSWEVCRQPWHPGDLLMLRIAKSATAASATIKPVCVDDNAAPTATPTPKTTPTASPTPQQPTATVVPTATPAVAPAPSHTPTSTTTHTPSPAPTSTPDPTATPESSTGGVSGALDTPTPTNTPTSTHTTTHTPTASSTHTPTTAPTLTATPDGSGDVVSGQ